MTQPSVVSPPAPAAVLPAPSRRSRRLSWPARLAALVLVALVFVAILADLVAPYDPTAIDPLNSFGPPRGDHLLGQDFAGRDIFSRTVFGARLALLGPALVVALAIAVGVPLGMAAAWHGGIFDAVVSRVADGLLAIPPLLLAIVITAAFGGGFLTAVIAIGLTYIPLMLRVSRGLVLVERRKTYVDALTVQAVGTTRIISRHVLPNMRRPMVAQATVVLGYALIDLAGLSFLGLGIQPPTADWGVMLAEGRSQMLSHPTEIVAASLAIAVTVVAVNVLGDALSAATSGVRR